MNEEFMNQLYKHNGMTNMNDYYFQFIKEKKSNNVKEYLENLKVPSTAMLPPTTSLLNVNQVNNFIQRTVLPANMNPNINNNMMKNNNNPLFNANYYPNLVRNPIMFHPKMQMQNLYRNNNMNSINNINPMINKMMPPMNMSNINY